MQFRVWGFIDGTAFDFIFESVADWKRERRVIERLKNVSVRGMVSVGDAA